MQRIKITLPATLTDFGPGLSSLGLALRLHATVEVRPREDEQLTVEMRGEGADAYPLSLRHPVLLAMMRVFQQHNRAPMGMTIRIHNQIPLIRGLGAQTAFTVAGAMAADNLLGISVSRDEIMQLAVQVGARPDGAITTMLGGLTASLTREDGQLVYRTLPIKPFEMVFVLPEIENFSYPTTPETVPLNDVLQNIRQIPLLIEALRTGDMQQLVLSLEDHIFARELKAQIPGYGHAVEVARRAGAGAITLCGGPGMLIFAERNQRKIAEAVELAFINVGLKVRSWVLPVDTQGVVISVAQSA